MTKSAFVSGRLMATVLLRQFPDRNLQYFRYRIKFQNEMILPYSGPKEGSFLRVLRANNPCESPKRISGRKAAEGCRTPKPVGGLEASWSAAVLCRFGRALPKCHDIILSALNRRSTDFQGDGNLTQGGVDVLHDMRTLVGRSQGSCAFEEAIGCAKFVVRSRLRFPVVPVPGKSLA